MSTQVQVASSRPFQPSMADYFLRRLHSLTGLVPIGAFVLEHYYTNLKAVGQNGAQQFDGVVRELQGNPLVLWAEVLLIGLPLLFHSIYGLLITAQARPNNASQRSLRNWMYTLQRVTGIVLLLYIGYHVTNTRLRPYWDPDNTLWQTDNGHKLVSFAYMRSYLGSVHFGVPVLSLYLIGVTAAAFHLANGLWNMGLHWGLTVGRRAQRVSGLLCGLIFFVLLAVGLTALFAFVPQPARGTPL